MGGEGLIAGTAYVRQGIQGHRYEVVEIDHLLKLRISHPAWSYKIEVPLFDIIQSVKQEVWNDER